MAIRNPKEQDWRKIDEVFEAALDLPAEERRHYLDRVCDDDAALRQAVEGLIEADQKARSFLGEPLAEALGVALGAGAKASGAEAADGATTRSERPRATDERPEIAAGQMLAGRYRIVRLLGEGGMGQVYQAEDLTLGLTIALKFLAPAHQQDPLRLELFLNEVRLARQIAHSNVCQVYDVIEADNRLFLSMEYVDGENLATQLRRAGRLPRERALALALELCRGLEAAHAQGILHRDLKPENLMIDRAGHLRIADFGLARLYGSAAEAASAVGSTLTKVHAGTPAYMAPELHLGREASVESDLYALGLVLYELFTGERAFPSGPALDQAPLAPSSRAEGLEPEIEREILRCLDADPQRRPASAGELVATLRQIAAAPWRPAPGLVIPHRASWRLERRLGSGGFGQAWLALHRETGTPRVFKFCHEAVHLEALKREITLFRLLKERLGERDDITRILDWNFDEPPWFIESEFTAGGHLGEWAEQQGGLAAVALEERLEIVIQVATALAAAHSIGVLHKDVKPSNILMRTDEQGQGRAQLADFGIGTVLEHERLEQAGITALGFTHGADPTLPPSGDQGGKILAAGTRLYMAPELLEGKPATLQADLYALGVVLYQMVVADLDRALALGWQDDVDDELLREDIAAAVDGRTDHRLADVQALAECLRQLPARRAARHVQEQRRREAEANRLALAASRRRWRLGMATAGMALIFAVLVLFHATRIEKQAARTRDAALSSIAGERLLRDPTGAALVLLEVEDPTTSFVAARMRDALGHELAQLELRGHTDVIVSVDWSPDGQSLLTASYDGTARVWDANSGWMKAVLEGGDDTLGMAVWSPDGQRVAMSSSDGTARVQSLAAAAEPLVLRGYEDETRPRIWSSVAWSPDGHRLATTSSAGTARIWEARGGELLATLHGHTETVWKAAWSPDGTRVVTTSHDHTARIWRLGDRRGDLRDAIVLAGHEDWVWTAAWNPEGTLIVTASNDLTARVWSAEGEPRLVLRGHEGRVWMAVWSPDGRHVATAADDGKVRVWALRGARGEDTVPLGGARGGYTAELVFVGEHQGGVRTVVWHPDESHLLSTSKDRTARVWKNVTERDSRLSAAERSIVLRGHGGLIEAGAWSPDGTRVVTGAGDMTARVWRPGSAETAAVLADPPAGRDSAPAVDLAAWRPNGRDVLLVSGRTGEGDLRGKREMRLASRADGTAVVLADPGDDVATAAWSPDGRHLLLGLAGGTAMVRDSEDRSLLVLEGHGGPVRAVAWSPSGRRVLTASGTHVYLRTLAAEPPASSAPARRLVHEGALVLDGHREIQAAAWSPDGTRVAVVSADGMAWIRNADPAAASTEPEVMSIGALHGIMSVAWSLDGTFLLTGLADGSLLAWDLDREGRDPVRLEGHTVRVSQVVFHPAGDRFATSAEEGRVLVWSLEEIRGYSASPAAGARSYRPRTTLVGRPAPILALTWSVSGRAISTAARDGTVKTWRLDVEDLRSALRAATQMCLDPEFREDVLGEAAAGAHRRYEECERSRGRRP